MSKSYVKYVDSVQIIADIIQDRLDEDPNMDIYEAVHENVDSSRWIIYHHKTIKVLEHSDNDPDEWEHYVSDMSDWRSVIQAMAFDCMRNDIYDELSRREIV